MEINQLIFLLLSVALNFDVLLAKTYKLRAFFTHAQATSNPSSANFTINIENKTLLNIEGDIFEKLPDPIFKVKVIYYKEEKQITVLDRETSFCTIGTLLTINPITGPVVDSLGEQSNWKFKCPLLARHYYTRKFEYSHYSDMAFPPVDFKIEIDVKNTSNQALKMIFKLVIDGVYKIE